MENSERMVFVVPLNKVNIKISDNIHFKDLKLCEHVQEMFS